MSQDNLAVITVFIGCVSSIAGVIIGAILTFVLEEYRYSRKTRLSNVKLVLDWSRNGKNSSLRKMDLQGSILKNVNLGGNELNSGADLSYANLRNVDLSYASLKNANLSYSDLSGANLLKADLTNADLSHAKGANASFTGSILERTNFTYAEFTASTFCEAKIIGTLFIRALLLRSNFKGAIFELPNLYESDFRGSIISEDQIKKCETSERTKFK